MFYDFDQNNSGGFFVVNDKVCHRILIEADTKEEAMMKAEELGCYWDGVARGIDCPCCGDRWYSCTEVNIEKYTTEGHTVTVYGGIYDSAEDKWNAKYCRYEIVEKPAWIESFGVSVYAGKVRFKDIEEYAQYLADEYGWTVPDIRIYYKNGKVKDVYSIKENL